MSVFIDPFSLMICIYKVDCHILISFLFACPYFCFLMIILVLLQIDLLEDVLIQWKKSKTYEILHNEIFAQVWWLMSVVIYIKGRKKNNYHMTKQCIL